MKHLHLRQYIGAVLWWTCSLSLCPAQSATHKKDAHLVHPLVFGRTSSDKQQARSKAPGSYAAGRAVSNIHNSMLQLHSGPDRVGIGYLCCFVACLCFGSTYIPVKKVEVRDGQFFSLCLSVGILAVGSLQWALHGFYKFEPFAMVGGMLWATGNLFVPFIIKRCGLGIGQLVWSVTNMLTGWAFGTFGLLGKNMDSVSRPILNYFGVLVTLMSLTLFLFMEGDRADGTSVPEADNDKVYKITARSKFTSGFFVALLAGFFMGSNFNPPTYLQQQGQADMAAGLPEAKWSHSPFAMDYVFSHFCGIFVASAMYFLAYLAMSPSRFYGKEVVLPGLAAGLLWGIAQVAWFKANGALSYVVAFPIIVGVPGVLAAFWGCVLFGENRGRRNLSILALVIAVQAVGVMCIAFSKGS